MSFVKMIMQSMGNVHLRAAMPTAFVVTHLIIIKEKIPDVIGLQTVAFAMSLSVAHILNLLAVDTQDVGNVKRNKKMTKRQRVADEPSKTSLYDLPKDVLAYMVSTIGADSAKEVERLREENQRLGFLVDFFEEMHEGDDLEHGKCYFETCKCYCAYGHDIDFCDDDDMFCVRCYWCRRLSCSGHAKVSKNGTFVCRNCKYIYD